MSPKEKASYLLEHSQYATLATADRHGKPWGSPVFFCYDDAYSLYWVSAKDAQHSINIHARPEVCITILAQLPDSAYDGLYIGAKAYELSANSDIEAAITVLQKRGQHPKFTVKSTDDVTGPAIWRIYKAAPIEISKRSDTGKIVNGQYVTIREPIKLLAPDL